MLLLTGALLGALVGVFLWTYIFLLHGSIHLLWHLIPQHLPSKLYPILLCGVGGILIGLLQRRYGAYPQELEEIIHDFKAKKPVRYDLLPVITVAAFLPLIFGGSIGPEAGLSGIIVGLSAWIGGRLRSVYREGLDFSAMGLSAALAVVFEAPLFGLVAPIEADGEVEIPRRQKLLANLVAILGALGAYMLLRRFLGGGMEMPRFTDLRLGLTEWIALVPLALLGCLFGASVPLLSRLVRGALRPLEQAKVVRALVGGLVLGTVGVLLPNALFSGEAEIFHLQAGWQVTSAVLLLITGLVKLGLVEVCFQSGWRGGKIFPFIFAGTCFGYAVASLVPVNPTFSVAVLTASFLAFLLRKPLAVALLLLLCYPVEALLPILLAAAVGAFLPVGQGKE